MNYKQRLVNKGIRKNNIKKFFFFGRLLEGNRREGRRPSYAFEYSSPPQIMPPPPPPPPSSASAFLASPLAHRPCKNKNRWIY